MTIPFIGRNLELQKLKDLFLKKTSSLVVIKGRRRIGKSRLVQEFGKDALFYEFTGLAPTKKTTKLSEQKAFKSQLEKYFKDIPDSNSWLDMLLFLAESTKNSRVVIFFDEISWMASKDNDFLGILKMIWDNHFSKNSELILIFCGSVSLWIEQNIISSKGFMGRISLILSIKELPLYDCNMFWNNTLISSFEKLKILSITGGIPRYLEEIIPSFSAEQNITNLCFKSSGVLFNEFDQIFSDLFNSRSHIYKKIIFFLNDKKADRSEIAEHLKIKVGGVISGYLKDLIEAGFIQKDYTWGIKDGKTSKLNLYRLSDNYLRFYMKYIEPNKRKIENDVYEYKTIDSLVGWSSIMGFQFENLVLNNRITLQKILKIAPSEIVSEGAYFQRKTERNPGCQIDYMIQTKFDCLYICEIKFSKNEIKEEVIDEVKEKIKRLKTPKNFSFRPVLIHVNGVRDCVTERGFFSQIINFEEFLNNTIDR